MQQPIDGNLSFFWFLIVAIQRSHILVGVSVTSWGVLFPVVLRMSLKMVHSYNDHMIVALYIMCTFQCDHYVLNCLVTYEHVK